MSKSTANAHWKGTIKEGSGEMSFTGYKGPYNFASRFEDGKETNPEELVGAALAGCYSMFISALLSKEELNPESIETTAQVELEKDDTGPHIAKITLHCKVKCQDLSNDKLQEVAATSKANCPVSRLYQGGSASINVNAELLS